MPACVQGLHTHTRLEFSMCVAHSGPKIKLPVKRSRVLVLTRDFLWSRLPILQTGINRDQEARTMKCEVLGRRLSTKIVSKTYYLAPVKTGHLRWGHITCDGKHLVRAGSLERGARVNRWMPCSAPAESLSS